MEIRQGQIIEFTLGNIESIREGMKKYRDLLQEDLVNVENEMDVVFTYREDEELKPLQAKHGEVDYLRELEKVSMESYTGREETFESVSSEGIFFSHALRYGELLEDIAETAREIVNYARRHNDTWGMWADDMGVFGLDALYLLAKKHPEYTYLIGGFIIPYWDDEHADYAFRYLQQIYRESGFTDDLMKAFCYCDSDQARMAMLGISYDYRLEDYFDLGRYLKEDPAKYGLFKAMLRERFEEQRFLQYSKDTHTDRPIQKVYGVIMASSNPEMGLYDDDDYIQGLEGIFIEDSYDNESFELQQEIEASLGYPLAEKQDEDDEEVYEDDVWRDFFINGFDEGEKIWAYIMSGEGGEVLEGIEPTDVEELSKERGLLFYKEKIQWFIGGYDSVQEEFHRIFEGFITEYYEEPEGNLRTIVNGMDTSGRESVVRALDVFYRLLDEPIFTNDLFNMMISYKVMTTDEFVERYDLDTEPTIGHLSSLLSDPIGYTEYSTREDIDRIYRYIDADRERAKLLFNGEAARYIEEGREEKVLLRGDITKQRDVQIKLLKDGLFQDASAISVITYLLEREWKHGRSDELTRLLTDYAENNWLDLMMGEIEEQSSLTKDEIREVRTYIAGRPAPPKELFMKALTQGRDALTEEERGLLNPGAGGMSVEEVSGLLRERLKRSSRRREYKIFNDMTDRSLMDIIPALYFGGFRLNLKSSGQMQKALKLLTAIAPIKVMTAIYEMCHAQIEGYTTYDFRMDVRKLSQPEILGLAIEIHGARDEDYKPYVDMFIEAEDEPSRGMFREFSKGEFKEALSYLDSDIHEEFMGEVKRLSPETPDYLGFFMEELKEFVEINLKEELYKGGKGNKKALADETHELLKGYLERGNDGVEDILAKLESVSTRDTLVKVLWQLEDRYIDRFLRLLLKRGAEGIEHGISNRAMDAGLIEEWDYLERISTLGASTKELLEYGIEWGVGDALIIANRREDIYPHIKELSLNKREEALNLVRDSGEMIGFISKMTGDTSVRIRELAADIRDQII